MEIMGKTVRKTAMPSIVAIGLLYLLAGTTGAMAAVDAPVALGGGAGGGISPAVESFLIILREGFEAMLIVMALVVYMRRRDAETSTVAIWWGLGTGIAASVVMAWAMDSLFSLNPDSKGVFEGLTMLAAALVMFYVSYWMFARREAERWNSFVKGQAEKAASRDSLFALGMVAFLAVLREGAETVLFVRAVFADNAGFEETVWTGLAIGSVSLVVLFYIFRNGAMRIPIGLFFSLTAIFLYFMAVRFTGTGVHELQEAGWVVETAISSLPRIKWIGLYPTFETVTAQLIAFAPLAIGAAIMWHKRQGETASS